MSKFFKFTPQFRGIHAKQKLQCYRKIKQNLLAVQFLNWCENIQINTKDYGLIRFSPNIWTLLQWKIVEAFFDKDVETIYVLKARQLGGTTICILLDLFAAFAFPHLRGIIVGADYNQVLIPISLIREIYRNLPKELKIQKIEDNVHRIRFKNNNVLNYFYPSRRISRAGLMGRGAAINYAHFTEVAFMANEEDLITIESSLSTHYPFRKYIYETPLALDTPVLTTEGWKTIGEIKEGDYVYNELGNPVKVIGTSPIFTNKVCYKITFSNGEEIIADEDHLWTVWERKYNNWHKKTVKTKDLIPNKHKLKLPKPLQFPNRELPIDPYLLGLWLGDGRSDCGKICGTKEDLEEYKKILITKGIPEYKISFTTSKGLWFMRIKGLKEKLKKLNLLNNKHIPEIYLFSSEYQRRELLAGLLDTDGSIDKINFSIHFANTNIKLLDDFCFLLSSLGIRYTREETPGSKKERRFPNGKFYTTSYAERVIFSESPLIPLFKLSRKENIHINRIKNRKACFVENKAKAITVSKIEKIESVPVKCIAVDSESHLFLVGKTLIPTHNTANGYNFFYERWEVNKEVPSSKLIFIGWWGREDYVLTNEKELTHYLKKKVFEWEDEKIKEVKEKYGITIHPAQIAWWRKQAEQKFKKDETSILSEFPFTEEDAFSASTYNFLESAPSDFLYQHRKPPVYCYQIFWGTNWYDMDLQKSSIGALKIFKDEKEKNPFAKYIIGVDPAFSVDPESNNSAIQVLECYADRIEQVAEFALATIDLQRLAMLTLYLAQKYDALINYEVQGGGQAFMPFLQNVYYLAKTIQTENPIWNEIKKAILREYIYRRRDSLGTQGAKGVVMTYDLKRRAYATLQSLINSEMIYIRSGYLINEIKNIVFEGGEFLLKKRMSTDRLMALLIALIAYQDIQYTLPTYQKALEKLEDYKKNKEKEEQERVKQDFNEYLKIKWFKDILQPSLR